MTSTVLMQIASKIKRVDYFGFVVNVPECLFNIGSHVAMDKSGDVYIYTAPPENRHHTGHWACTEGRALLLVEFDQYEDYIEGLLEWCSLNWSKSCVELDGLAVLP